MLAWSTEDRGCKTKTIPNTQVRIIAGFIIYLNSLFSIIIKVKAVSTKIINNMIVSNGGRVLNFVIRSKNFKENRNRALDLINQIGWNNGFFRKDIGYKVIDE